MTDQIKLTTVLEGADERVAEIQGRHREAGEIFSVYGNHTQSHFDRATLLEIATALSAKLKKSDAQNKEIKLRYRSAMRVMEPVREKLQNICDDIEEEGDRTYFGSTNHADDLKSIAQGLDDARWDDVVRPFSEFDGELHPFDEMRRERDDLQAKLTTARNVLELAQRWLLNSVPTTEIDGPKPLPVIAEVLRALPSPQVKP